MTADVMFVNGVPFLVSLARGLNLLTAEFLPVRTAKSLASRIKKIKHLYGRGGFTVGTILMDNEFENVRPLVPNLHINTTAAKEHVPKIERVPEHPSFQENAAAHTHRAHLSCRPLIERVPVQIRRIPDPVASRNRPPTPSGF